MKHMDNKLSLGESQSQAPVGVVILLSDIMIIV